MFIRFDTTHKRDRHTHTLHDGIGRAYASHHAAKTLGTKKLNHFRKCTNAIYPKLSK